MSESRVAIVTGAATGIGRASASRLANDGFSVVINFRSKKSETDDLLASLGAPRHIAFQGDISDANVAKDLVETTIKKFGQIDVLVNAAGIFEEHDITSLDYENWQKSWDYNLRVNLVAPMNLAFCAAQHMIKKRRGKIINITSRGAFRGEPDAPAYGASKSGLNSASQSLAKALAPHGIAVFAIAPGWVETPLAEPYLSGSAGEDIRKQSPLGRIGTPDEIANVVSFLSADGTDYITGAIIDVNGASYFRN